MTNTEHLTVEELAKLIRTESEKISEGFTVELEAAIKTFQQAGIEAGVHVGRTDLDDKENTRDKLEWFAGQLISITDSKAYFAVNAWVNCTEKFTKI